ncbi:MAG: phosphonopyruvate decarboxylase [Treponema sp.]|nr:phosphonopyruvate decarboxylase [Treponema sp.]
MNIDPQYFIDLLLKNGTGFFTGVPDSLLKSFCFLAAKNNHITAVNEGAAIALGAGYYLATGKIPCVYMQNSGIGNAVNPLLSLTDSEVYSIPIILLIGWRGEPGVKDEPQHLKQGKVTCDLFDAMKIPYLVLSDNHEEVKKQLDICYAYLKKENSPFALIARKDTFAPLPQENKTKEKTITREEAIEKIILSSSPDEVYICTTGMASRELFELRKKYNMQKPRDFLTVGSMGHASSIALSIAVFKPNLSVTCIDGDGALLMHMGNIAAIGERAPLNLRHIVINNASHDSVGGQPSIAPSIDFCALAKACGYKQVHSVTALPELGELCSRKTEGPVFIEVLASKGNRKDLGRPDKSPKENKKAFMQCLEGKI